jgi:hypothetical protein
VLAAQQFDFERPEAGLEKGLVAKLTPPPIVKLCGEQARSQLQAVETVGLKEAGILAAEAQDACATAE